MSLGLALNVTPTQPQRFWPPFWDGEPGRFVPGRDLPGLRETTEAWQIPAWLRFARPASQIQDSRPPGSDLDRFPAPADGLEASADSRPAPHDYRRPGKSLPGRYWPGRQAGWPRLGWASLAWAGLAGAGLGQIGRFAPKWFLAITCNICLRLEFRPVDSARFFGTQICYFRVRG